MKQESATVTYSEEGAKLIAALLIQRKNIFA